MTATGNAELLAAIRARDAEWLSEHSWTAYDRHPDDDIRSLLKDRRELLRILTGGWPGVIRLSIDPDLAAAGTEPEGSVDIPVSPVTPPRIARVAPRMRLPAVSEREFRAQLVGPNGLATMLGYLHVGFRPAQTAHGWRTPVTGELGEGWPDLVLVNPARRRLLFRELKRDGEKPGPMQQYVLGVLSLAGCDAAWWTPADLDSGLIQRELAG